MANNRKPKVSYERKTVNDFEYVGLDGVTIDQAIQTLLDLKQDVGKRFEGTKLACQPILQEEYLGCDEGHELQLQWQYYAETETQWKERITQEEEELCNWKTGRKQRLLKELEGL